MKNFNPWQTLIELALAIAIATRDGSKPWEHCRFQIDRATMGLVTKFSYDDSSPWTIDSERLDALDEQVEWTLPACSALWVEQ